MPPPPWPPPPPFIVALGLHVYQRLVLAHTNSCSWSGTQIDALAAVSTCREDGHPPPVDRCHGRSHSQSHSKTLPPQTQCSKLMLYLESVAKPKVGWKFVIIKDSYSWTYEDSSIQVITFNVHFKPIFSGHFSENLL